MDQGQQDQAPEAKPAVSADAQREANAAAKREMQEALARQSGREQASQPDQAAQAVQVAREVLADFVANGPTEAELTAAKSNLTGGFALSIDSNRKLLDNVANIAGNGLALDYLDSWTQQIDKVTVEQIKAAFARKLQPDRMVTVVVGGAE